MDRADADPEELRSALAFIRRINVLLGYTRATLHHLKRFSRSWKAGERITILDLATGSADIPRAILKWARRSGFDLHVTGLDLHPTTASAALAENPDPSLIIVRGDALHPPFADGSFDYVLTNMFLHHLDEAEVVQVMREMNRLACRGVIIADLLRHRRAYFWIRIFSAFAGRIVRHDAPASVAQAFVKREILDLRDQAEIPYAAYFRHFGHRFVLAGCKPHHKT